MPIESERIPLDESEGQWVLNQQTRVLEWRFFPPVPDSEPAVEDVVECPFCGAGIGQGCRTRRGNRVQIHTQRAKARKRQWAVITAPAVIPVRPAPKCGTDSGYYHHRRKLNEAACTDCRVAHAEAERERRLLRRAVA